MAAPPASAASSELWDRLGDTVSELDASLAAFCADSTILTAFDADDVEVEDEQTHAWYSLYVKYQELFDTKLEGLIADEGLTIEEFAAVCDENKASEAASHFLSMVEAKSSYERFLHYVRSEKKALKEGEEAAEDLGF